ncbi:hypothetical protein ABVT39_023911, partial [Epinephelus coioides]
KIPPLLPVDFGAHPAVQTATGVLDCDRGAQHALAHIDKDPVGWSSLPTPLGMNYEIENLVWYKRK